MGKIVSVEIDVNSKKAQDNINELNKSLDASKDYIIELERELIDLEKQLDKTPKKQLAAQKELRDKIEKTKLSIRDEKLSVKEIMSERSKYADIIKENTDEREKYNDTIEEGTKLESEAQKQNEATAKSIKNIEKSSSSAAKGIKGIGTALKAAGIGLIIAAVSKFTEVLKENQTIADGLSRVFEFVSSVLNQVTNALVTTYESVTKSTERFDALTKVLSSVFTIGITPLKAGFFALKLGIQEVQYAWEKWIGDADPERLRELDAAIQETKNSLIDTAKSTIQAGVDIYNNVGEAIGEITDIGTEAIENLSKVSVKAAWENSKTIVELRKQAELAAVINQGLIEKYDRQAEQLRQIRDDETKTLTERIAANEELGKVLDEQKKTMLENAQAAVDLAKYDLEKNNSLDNQKALQESLNELAAIEAQITGFQSEQLINKNSLLRESQELTQSETEAQNQRGIASAEAGSEAIRNEVLRLERLREIADQERLLEEQRLSEKRDSYEKGTQAYVDANNELLDYQSDAKQKELQLDRDIEQAKIENRRNTLDNVITLAGEESKVGKALFLAKQALLLQEIISEARKTITFSALSAARSSAAVAEGTAQTAKIGFPQNIPMLIGYAAQAVGIISAIKSATGKANEIAGAYGVGGGTSFTPEGISVSKQIPKINTTSFQPNPPQLETVGSSGVNQLAETIAIQNNKPNEALDKIVETLKSNNDKPIKAYVVSKDVSTAQELDRNKVSSASI